MIRLLKWMWASLTKNRCPASIYPWNGGRADCRRHLFHFGPHRGRWFMHKKDMNETKEWGNAR